jgi:hypothetical protein
MLDLIQYLLLQRCFTAGYTSASINALTAPADNTAIFEINFTKSVISWNSIKDLVAAGTFKTFKEHQLLHLQAVTYL